MQVRAQQQRSSSTAASRQDVTSADGTLHPLTRYEYPGSLLFLWMAAIDLYDDGVLVLFAIVLAAGAIGICSVRSSRYINPEPFLLLTLRSQAFSDPNSSDCCSAATPTWAALPAKCLDVGWIALGGGLGGFAGLYGIFIVMGSFIVIGSSGGGIESSFVQVILAGCCLLGISTCAIWSVVIVVKRTCCGPADGAEQAQVQQMQAPVVLQAHVVT